MKTPNPFKRRRPVKLPPLHDLTFGEQLARAKMRRTISASGNVRLVWPDEKSTK
jgi:hypothetical protein